MKDFTFSDGTFVPKGTTIGVATGCIHLDDRFYENAEAFKPFRFADMEEPDKHQFVSTSIEYHVFGHGMHAWYGLSFSSCSTEAWEFEYRLVVPDVSSLQTS